MKRIIKRILRRPVKFIRWIIKNLLRDCIDDVHEEIEEAKRDIICKTDKQIETWTWKRFQRTQEEIYSVLFDLDRDKMQQAISCSPTYDVVFYLDNRIGSIRSAQRILSIVLKWFPHESIVDFGCGTGTWLWVAQAFGVREILGIDGDYVPRPLLIIPENCFMPADLDCPIVLEKRYDIAMSLEVAEHLRPESATCFVDSLCKSADVVLFSAAHPGQGGNRHINEQPMEYWIEKFAAYAFVPIEIRPFFREDRIIKSWYKENLVLFVHKSRLDEISTKIAQMNF